MIPQDRYDPKRATDLLWYLIQELRRTMTDRGNIESDWMRYEQVYRARPVNAEKTFPFANASNLVIPVAATDVDTLFARLMGLLMEPSNLWSVTPQRPEFAKMAAATEDFLEWAQHNELDIHGPVGDWILELHKLGTGIIKQRYTREMKKVYEWRELQDGTTWQQQAVILLKDKPAIHNTRLIDFYIPAGFRDIQSAPWVAERIRLTWQQYMNRVKAGIYTGSDQIGAWFSTPPVNTLQRQLDAITGFVPSQNKQMEFYEFWVDFDIDGDGWDEALVCTVHLESQTYVRLDFNPFFNQDKPYSAARFMRDTNGFYGIGLGEMLDYFQEEITAMHNQRIDSGTVGNSTMLKVRSDETGIRKDEPMYPGKQWRVADMNNVETLAFGTPGTAPSIEAEGVTRNEAQRRTGVSDYVQAQAGPATAYGSAYTTQQMILASSKRFGETLREIRVALGETGTRVLELYQQHNPRGKEYMAVGQKEGELVSQVLHFPMDLIRRGMLVGVTAIDTQTSKDAQIRTTTLVLQQLMQYYSGYMNAMSYAVNPQMPPEIKAAALQMANGSTELMAKLLHLYGVQDTASMLPIVQGAVDAQNAQLQLLQQGAVGTQSGGAPPPMGASGPAGMGMLPSAGGTGPVPAGLATSAPGGGPPQGSMAPG
jgi:hypothetical protein